MSVSRSGRRYSEPKISQAPDMMTIAFFTAAIALDLARRLCVRCYRYVARVVPKPYADYVHLLGIVLFIIAIRIVNMLTWKQRLVLVGCLVGVLLLVSANQVCACFYGEVTRMVLSYVSPILLCVGLISAVKIMCGLAWNQTFKLLVCVLGVPALIFVIWVCASYLDFVTRTVPESLWMVAEYAEIRQDLQAVGSQGKCLLESLNSPENRQRFREIIWTPYVSHFSGQSQTPSLSMIRSTAGTLLSDLCVCGVVLYHDDLLVHSPTSEDHCRSLSKSALRRLRWIVSDLEKFDELQEEFERGSGSDVSDAIGRLCDKLDKIDAKCTTLSKFFPENSLPIRTLQTEEHT
eukprot:Gregarina_sp_Pseudo_9__1326@NODE_1889_length_1274_cov_7_614575_g1753_i0_p1_GENE_NODE_1889_length_1274_cov_7_614575_g1753_i0NODE_1889_length_1274_cov_7_614575_g1753_i0_p1_ORF_typecomplete_len371_score29_20HeLo/PF14479_6/0_14YfhO/PF09586_10/0_69RseC_MucC/PF04246_12/78RseC_MucC/PF04246_12/1_8_NODE_1889_length_1274_cov_7_614575_g1753_i0701113